MNLASSVTRDYLTDARIGKLPFMKLKKFLSDNGVGAMEAAAASIQARHRGKLTRQATSQKLAEARMSGVKQ